MTLRLCVGDAGAVVSSRAERAHRRARRPPACWPPRRWRVRIAPAPGCASRRT